MKAGLQCGRSKSRFALVLLFSLFAAAGIAVVLSLGG